MRVRVENYIREGINTRELPAVILSFRAVDPKVATAAGVNLTVLCYSDCEVVATCHVEEEWLLLVLVLLERRAHLARGNLIHVHPRSQSKAPIFTAPERENIALLTD